MKTYRNTTQENDMSTLTLTDARYRAIGYIDTARDGIQTAREARYYKVGHGNPLAALISGR
jgi:hypothetical protein